MKISYRPELDGIRAIAIISVILYHAQITIFGSQIFKGGFIGVDIFFVISGYLITSIILKELISTDNFLFKNFYERRIRRIIPGLLFVMFLSLPLAWIYLNFGSLLDFSKSIFYSLGFTSNFYFHYSGTQYADEDGLLKPFLHTWSLAVEEQFYILFPIVLLVIFKYFRKYLLVILVVIFIISLLIANWGSKNYPSATFYFLHARFFELLAGSILAYFEIQTGHRSKNERLNAILPLVGLLLICHSIFYFNDKIFHPSFYTLSPILGVCLIIWFVNKNNFIYEVLSSKLFVGTGLISYSLYLWHYPIFAFSRIIDINLDDNFSKLILVLITIVLSIFSYFFIERPSRNKNYSFKKILKIIILSVLILLIINILIIFNTKSKFLIKTNFYQEKPTYQYLTQNNKLCFDRLDDFCKFGSNYQNKKIYLIGDSHLGSLSYDLEKKLQNFIFIPITSAGYFHFNQNESVNKKTKKIDDNYKKLNLSINNELLNSKNNIIIFGGATSLYFYEKRFINKDSNWHLTFVNPESLEHNSELLKKDFINILVNLTKNNDVILLYPIPEIGVNIQKNKLNTESFTYKNFLVINSEVINFFDSLNLDRLHKVYPYKIFCNKGNECVAGDDKGLYFSDRWHPSLYGATLINNLIIDKIRTLQ
jgi:peptidoglycan/LPS O-acetylase OafA/YrhL